MTAVANTKLGEAGPDESGSGAAAEPDHLVQFYDADELLCETVGDFLGSGLGAGDRLVVIATEAHRAAFVDHLRRKGWDVERAIDDGRLTLLDAAETLSRFMVGRTPDEALFRETIGSVLDRIAAGEPSARIRAYGEMVDLLWRDGNPEAALRLEEMWNGLRRDRAFSLFCAYVMASFYKQPGDLARVCESHGHVVRPDDAPPSATAEARQVRQLAAEIAQRKEIEQTLRASLRKLWRAEEDLRRKEGELADFVENAAVALHWVDSEGRIVWANRAELDLLGYQREEYIGRPVTEFHVDPPVIAELLARLRRNEEVHDFEARLRARDGSIRHVLITSNVRWRDGQFLHTRCFTRDITERRQAEEALRRDRAQLRTITDALPVLISYVDAQQRYRMVNRAYERWFGVSSEEIVGKHVREILGETAYSGLRPHIEAALSGRAFSLEALVPYRFGGERFVEISYIPDTTPDGRTLGYSALIADVTDRKRFEAQREAAARRNEQLGKVASAIADAIAPDEVTTAVVDSVASACGASSAGLWLLEDGGQVAKLVRSMGYHEAARALFGSVPLDSPRSFPALDCIRRGEAIWIDSQADLVARYPQLEPVVTPGRSYRVACLPLVVHGAPIGALAFTFDGAPALEEEQRSFLQVVARHAGQALERLRLLEAERNTRALAEASAARMGVLNRASRAFSEAGADLSLLLRVVVEQALAGFADAGGVLLLPDGGDTLELAAVHHRDPEAAAAIRALLESAPPKLGEGLTGRVALTGESILVPEVDPTRLLAMARPEARRWLERYAPRTLIVVPLRARGKIIGVLAAMRREHPESFTEEDRLLLEELAERAALAIESTRLQRENQHARERAELLYELAGAVIGAERVEEVFDVALDGIGRALGASRSSILTFDPDGVMRFKAWRGLSDDYRRAVEGHSPWSRDAGAPEPIIVPDVRRDPGLSGYLPLFERERIEALGFIPLVAAGRLLGKFMVYYERPRALSAQELDMARAIANHVAAAVARFQSMAELRETIRYNELFAGVLAHDLRSPLGAILTAAQLVLRRQEGEGDRVSKPLGRIIAAGERMTRMIEQLLDFTRTRVGNGLEPQPRETDLGSLVRQVIDELEIANPEWKLALERTGDLLGTWDPDRLLQVVSNLVANAGQHGTSGRIRIRLDGTQADAVVLEVHNAGVIPASVLPYLFDPFRGTQRRADQRRGLGLGLFISKEIVASHGGSIDVSSSEAHGTTFVVRIPRLVAPPGVRPRPAAQSS